MRRRREKKNGETKALAFLPAADVDGAGKTSVGGESSAVGGSGRGECEAEESKKNAVELHLGFTYPERVER